MQQQCSSSDSTGELTSSIIPFSPPISHPPVPLAAPPPVTTTTPAWLVVGKDVVGPAATAATAATAAAAAFSASSTARAVPPGPELALRTCRRLPESLARNRSMPTAEDRQWAAVPATRTPPPAIGIRVSFLFHLLSLLRFLSSLLLSYFSSSFSYLPPLTLRR